MKFKKFISILMALVMVFSAFAVSATAWTGTDSQELRIETIADKETVNPGDTVTFTIKLYKNDASATENAFANIAISWMYNDTQITPTKLTYGDVLGNFSSERPIGKIVAATALTQVKAASTDEEKAAWDANGYNAICKLQGAKDNSSLYGSQGYWQVEDGMTLFVLECVVSDTVEPGTAVNFDMISGLVTKNHIAFQFVDTSNNNKAAYKYGVSYYDTTAGSVYLNNGGEVSAPVLTKGRAQYKMETLVPGVSVADNFQYRVLSTISKADWEAHFENTAVEGATTKALTEVGFIAADTATFDLNTAKTAVIANTTGDYTTGLPAGYKAATTNHIYRTDGDATFACRVDTSKDTCADLTYIAFAKYLDADGQPQVIFYDEAATVLLKSSYDDLVNRWLGR